MAYVPGFDYDIFVSYAHVDDLPDVEGEDGWVTTLVKVLQNRLAQALGRREAFSLWMDHQLARHVEITPKIVTSLEKTATLMAVLSPGYLASEWCGRERETFLKMVNERAQSGSRVFIVERDKVERDDRPEEFGELLGYRFWVQDRPGRPPRILGTPRPLPDDTGYYDILNDLARELAGELKRLRDSERERVEDSELEPVRDSEPERLRDMGGIGPGERPGPEHGDGDSRVTVFLAEVTDDLDPLQTELKRSLEQQKQLSVVPRRLYPREPSAFREAVAGDLKQSKLFVQLLSTVPGRKLPDSEETYVSIQYQLAADIELPILQWRSPELSVDSLGAQIDPVHRRLLEGASVQAIDFEDFKREIIKRAEGMRSKKEEPQPIGGAFVFVDVEPKDDPLAEELGDFLAARGYDVVKPIEGHPGRTAAEIRKDLEENILASDAIVVIYGETENTWVQGQLREVRKLNYRRDRPLLALTLYEGPPASKPPLGIRLQDMKVIRCHDGLDEKKLKPFLATIEEGTKRSTAKREHDHQPTGAR